MAKHIPILFSTEMVQAILDGRKKMTRRTKGLEVINLNPGQWKLTAAHKHICRFFSCENNPNPIEKYWIFEHKYTGDQIEVKCPYGVVRDIKEKSDILWVRESFRLVQPFDPESYYFGYRDGFYSDNEASEKYDYSEPDVWKPSIHMPKEACRIFLRVTDVRCERLQDITEQDAVDEGVKKFPTFFACDEFIKLWTKINGQKSWDENPYVWVVSFERCEMPTNFLNPIP